MTPLEPFFTAAQIRELARAALAARSAWRESDDRDQPRSSAFEDAAQSAISFCANAIALLDDPELWELAVALAEAEPHHGMDFRPLENAGIERLARHRRVESKLEPLVEHPSFNVRYALARGISAQSQRGKALLARLANDSNPHVRSRAAKRLAEAGETPWWIGKFRSDPYESMDEPERERQRAVIEELGELLGTAGKLAAELPRLAELTRALPDPLAAEVLEQALASGFFWEERVDPAVAELARRGDAGAAAVDRLRGQLEPYRVGSLLRRYVNRLAGPAREARCRAWLAELSAKNPSRTPITDDEDLRQRALAEVIGACWPADADPTELLEVGCERAGERFDVVVNYLGQALQRSTRDDLLATRLVNLAVRGFPAPWTQFKGAICTWLESRPALVADVVEKALRDPHEQTLPWALTLRLGKLHDPARDGTVADLAARLDEDPRVRPVLRASFAPYLLARLRPQLAAGALGADDAARVVMVVGFVNEAIVRGTEIMNWIFGPPKKPNHHLGLYGVDAVKDSPEACAPLTDLEWRRLREARANAPVSGREPCNQLDAMPIGPLHPDDRAYLNRVLAELRRHPEPVVAGCLAYVLAMCGELSDLDTLVELEQLPAGEDGERWCEQAYPHLRQHLRERLGVSRAAGPTLAVVPTPS